MQSITCVQDLLSLVDGHNEIGHIYRGQSSFNYSLIPSIGRYKKQTIERGRDLLRSEEAALSILAAEMSCLSNIICQNKLELMAIAQHHSLPTRLLDWTLSPLIALYFAVENGVERDAAVFILKTEKWIHGENLSKFDPVAITEPWVVMPRHVTLRMRAQQGVFTVQPNLDSELSFSETIKVKIEKGCIRKIKFQLATYGISEKTIYPDLDGLCRDLRFLHFSGFDD